MAKKHESLCPGEYFPSIWLKVFFTEDESIDYMIKVHKNIPVIENAADTVKDDNGNVVIRIKDYKEHTDAQLISLFAHESVHAAQIWCDMIGEDNPACEEMAYMVQTVFYCVYLEWEKYKAKH